MRGSVSGGRRSAVGWLAAGWFILGCATPGTDGGTAPEPPTPPPASLSVFRGSLVLGTPTLRAIRANIYSATQQGSAYLVYGTASGTYPHRSATLAITPDIPREILLDDLAADTRYYYRLVFTPTGGTPGSGPERTFQTARASGRTFTFALQGDSHPERLRQQFDSALYVRTLQTAAQDAPDFYFLLGDDFSIDNINAANPAAVTATQVRERYLVQRPFLGLIGDRAPLFLVNGNHEQAARYLLDGTPNNPAVWAQNARNTLFPQPAPDGFYSGNPENVPHIGLLRNYFAFTWGDALFVVLDPYWGSPVCVDNPFYGGEKRPDIWAVTHGDAQYQWLTRTLAESTARYKFVFAHHVMGTQRGGIEVARLYEWGGQSPGGQMDFAARRPSWPLPIHDLFVRHGVTAFFQGHDHIWAHQSLDGVVYQTLSEPADPNYSLFNADAFRSGETHPNSGYTRVTVGPAGVTIAYVRVFLPADEGPGRVSGSVAASYTLP